MPSIPAHTLFALQISLGTVGAIVMYVWYLHYHHIEDKRTWIDAALFIFLAAIVGARLWHIITDLTFYQDNPEYIIRFWFGGLHWRGALLGGVLALPLIARRQKLDIRQWADALALCIPFFIIVGWWSMRTLGYGYGISGDYPDWLTGFLPNERGAIASRVEVQIFGIWTGLSLLLVLTWLTINDRLTGKRLGISVLGLLISMLVLGQLRVHYNAVPDLLLLLIGIICFLTYHNPHTKHHHH